MAYHGTTASEPNNEDETIIEICRGSSPNIDSLAWRVTGNLSLFRLNAPEEGC
jgi:hypothetical protein